MAETFTLHAKTKDGISYFYFYIVVDGNFDKGRHYVKLVCCAVLGSSNIKICLCTDHKMKEYAVHRII